MSDPRLAQYERYLTAWSPVDGDERRRRLAETVADGIVYRDALARLSDAGALARHLDGFQERRPGCQFRLLSMLSWGQDALANWRFVDADGKPGFAGYDALTIDADGRIAGIVGFSDTDKQKLK